MERLVLYHNPNCSKSRGALEILRERDVEFDVVEYLKQAPSRSMLEGILAALSEPPLELLRQDKHFRELGLDPADYTTAEAVVELLLEHPGLMQRPIALRGGRGVIGRPPEKVLGLL